MENQKRIVIAADHTILRAGLRALFSFQNDLEVVGESGDGREAVRVVDEHVPDILLIDFSMPKFNGMEAISEIRNRHPQIKTIVLAVHKDAEYIVASLEAGADAYILKDANQNELILAIEYVMSGKIFLSPSISDTVLETYLEQKKNKKKKPKVGVLTSREKEILKLIAKGFKNRDIAVQLCISSKTVKTYRSNLKRKLKVGNTASLTAYSIEKGVSI